MPGTQFSDITNFFMAGINYKKTDADLRGKYAVNAEAYGRLLALCPSFGIKEVFVISTCNRTEIYGFAENATALCSLLCSQTQGSLETFNKIAYIKKGEEAISHFFAVASGLDSQILGDYEIVGQIKQAIRFSKTNGFIGAHLERMANLVYQSSKEIRTNTALSGGTVSVAFAAIQYIKEHVKDIPGKRILLIGTGKIGKNTCKNLVDYLDTKNITLVNRTEAKAQELAEELGLQFASAANMPALIAAADIILVATNSPEPIILKSYLENRGRKIIIDLSIPYNVECDADQLHNVTLVNVDELSKIKDATFEKRKAEVPKVLNIIKKYKAEFFEWHEMRKNVPVLRAVKLKLHAMQSCEMYTRTVIRQLTAQQNAEDKIQKVLNGLAIKMRSHNQHGCHYIEAINEYIATGTN